MLFFVGSVKEANREQAELMKDPEYAESQRVSYLHSSAKNYAKAAVKEALKSPSTASFSSLEYYREEDGSIAVDGKVTSQNSFGAELTQPFRVLMVDEGKEVPTFAAMYLNGELVVKDEPVFRKHSHYRR